MRSTLLAVLLAVAFPLSLRAQAPSLGTVSIRVVDAGQAPVPSAELMLKGPRDGVFSVRTDSGGTGTLADVPPGLWVLTVRRIGLKPVTNTIRIAAGENRYTVQVDEAAMTLTGMRVVGGYAYTARLDDFERRRSIGLPNAVVTREDIEKVRPIALTRMLRGISGIQIGDSLGNRVAVSTRGAKPTRIGNGQVGFGLVQCVLRVAVDGIMMPALNNIDQIIPNDVHGIEIYFGPARMPPELAGLRTDNWCGLIAIWTRDR